MAHKINTQNTQSILRCQRSLIIQSHAGLRKIRIQIQIQIQIPIQTQTRIPIQIPGFQRYKLGTDKGEGQEAEPDGGEGTSRTQRYVALAAHRHALLHVVHGVRRFFAFPDKKNEKKKERRGHVTRHVPDNHFFIFLSSFLFLLFVFSNENLHHRHFQPHSVKRIINKILKLQKQKGKPLTSVWVFFFFFLVNFLVRFSNFSRFTPNPSLGLYNGEAKHGTAKHGTAKRS